MVEDVNNSKKAVANACRNFYREKCRTTRRFLRRNIRHILDSHARELHLTSGAAPHEDMVANAKRGWGWDFPTTAMLEDFMNGDRPILQIESLQFRGPGSKGKPQNQARLQTDDDERLRWLPDPETDAIWPCTVSVSLSKPPNANRPFYRESISAKVLQDQRNGRSSMFDVKLDRPLFLEVNKLFIVTESGRNGGRSWKRTITTPYVLEITVQCQDSDDSAEFLSRIENKQASSYQHAPGNEGMLKATWEQLPMCPSEKEPLTIRRAQGHKSLELSYKLHVAMGWISRREFRLTTYDKVFESRNEEVRQLPTPSASDDMEKVVKRHCVVYKFRDSSDTRTFVVRGLTCPFCPDGKNYVYFERLMLHCKTHHSHFDFAPSYDSDKSEAATFHATVLVTIPSHVGERQDDQDEHEMNWIAPNRPFNIKSHIQGEDDWTGQVRTKSKKGSARHLKDKVSSAAPLTQPSRKRPAPEEVENLPEHRPKRHCVPYVPGVSFYRTTSKQEIQAGELVTESDDEVDDTWLAQSQEHALEELGLKGAARDFANAFNQHLASEQSDSSVLVRDALIRFTRSHIKELRHIEWQRQFRAKLNQLRGVGIIGDDIVSACVNLMLKARERKVNGETLKEAASAGAEEDSGGRSAKVRRSEQQPNGVHKQAHQRKDDADNVVRSTSPENDHVVPREGQNHAIKKALPHGKATANGISAKEAQIALTDPESGPNDNSSQSGESNDQQKRRDATSFHALAHAAYGNITILLVLV